MDFPFSIFYVFLHAIIFFMVSVQDFLSFSAKIYFTTIFFSLPIRAKSEAKTFYQFP